MSKTNYSKVEEALREGLQKMQVHDFLEKADEAAGKKKSSSTAEEHKLIVEMLENELKRLHKYDKQIYKKLETTKKAIKDIVSHRDNLSVDDWKKVKELKLKIKEYREEVKKKSEEKSDEERVKEERRKHINKRYDIKETWLPLD